MELLRSNNSFEPPEESAKREEVLAKLDTIVKEVVLKICVDQGVSDQTVGSSARIFTFGSYRLGVHSSGADIDVLCVAPRHVDRHSFFTELEIALRAQPLVKELSIVPEAYVPITKMKFDSVSIDMVYARLPFSAIDEDLDILDEANLVGVDEPTQRALNGPRVANEILKLVPNVDNFRITLRVIKLWSKNRGVYTNALGFWGGVALAVLTARVCQLYPNASPNMLVRRFFRAYEQWKWPTPIKLCETEHKNLEFRVWDPQINPENLRDQMPIITPVYPAMNTTYNVSKTTRYVIQAEVVRGATMSQEADDGQRPWSDLVADGLPEFWESTRHFLRIEICSDSEDIHTKWCGTMEARLRFLIQNLELVEGMYVRPWPYSFPVPEGSRGHPYATLFFFALLKPAKRAAQSSTAHVDLSKPVLQFLTRLQDRGEVLEGMFGPFINPVKRSNLPDFVFPGGRPVSTKKRRKKSMTSNGDSLDDPPKKRLHLEDQVEDVVELEASSSTTSGNAGPSNPPLGTTKKPKISLGDA